MLQQSIASQDGLPNYIFDTSNYPQNSIQTYDDQWKQYSMIKDHLDAHGCSNVDQMSQCMTHDLITFPSQSPPSQIFNELYHRSESPSFDQFLNDKAMSQLRQDHHRLFTLFQQYSSVYNKDICFPLKQYFLSKQQRFKGIEANKIMGQVWEIFKNCKKGIHRNGSGVQQMDAFFKLELSQENNGIHQEDDQCDSDDDDEYAAIEEEHAPSAPPKRGIPEFDPSQESFVNELRDVPNEIERIMREQLKPKTDEQYNYYSRYEMKFIGNSMHTLTATDTVPALSPDNTRLFREYHTINAIERAAVTMGNLACFSYHILESCIQLFVYIYVNGEIYGQRLYTKDLVPLFSELYPGLNIKTLSMDDQISAMERATAMENNNIEIDISKDLTFDDDEMCMEIIDSRPEEITLIEAIQNEITKEYNRDIASKIITVIEEDGYDDESIWEEVQEGDQSLLKDVMEPNEFKSLLRICRQYHDPSSVNKVVLFKRGKCVDQLERKQVKTKIYLEYQQNNVKKEQNEVSIPREIADTKALRSDVVPFDEEEYILEYAFVSSPPTDITIKISKEFIIQPLKMRIKEHFVNVENLYHYIDISTSLQIKDRQMKQISFRNQQICVINYDLHLKEAETECLYGVAVRVNNCWILDEFMTADQIIDSFNIDPESLPKSSRQAQAFKRKMSRLIITENVLDTTNWCNMEHNHGFITADDIPSSANTFKICRCRLIRQGKKSFEDPSLPQFRILVQDDNDYWMEWIKVIRVQYTSSFAFYTAIQYGYDQTQRSNLLKGLNDEPPEQLPYDIQAMVIEFCIPVQIKAIHHDPRYIFSLNKAVGNENSGSSVDQLLRLSPWPKQFEIGDFESEFETFVEILNAETHRTNVDISLMQRRITEQNIDFNYSYFLVNKFNVFRQTFPEFSVGRLKKIFWKLGGEKAIVDVDKKEVDFELNWNVEPNIKHHTLEPLFDAYFRIEILKNLSINSVEALSWDVVNLCKQFWYNSS